MRKTRVSQHNKSKNAGETTDRTTRLIRAALFAIVIALPLFMLPASYSVFDLPKAMLLVILACMLGLAWIIKFIREGRISWQKTPLDIPLALFLSTIVLSTALSFNPVTSLTGPSMTDRHETAVIWIAYLLIAAAASQFLTQRKTLASFLTTVVATAAIISIYAVFQYFGIDFFKYAVTGIDLRRPPGTLGQPTYLGSYLALAFPIATVLSISAEYKGHRLIYGIAGALIGVALLTTFTRGAWIGALVAIALIVVHAVRKRGVGTVRLSVLVAGILTMALLFAVASGSLGLIGERIVSMLSLSGSAAQRIGIWDSTIDLISERPVLGWGIETFEDVHPRAETTSLVKQEGGPIFADRPHNQLLYIAFSMGLLGVLVYLWLLFAVFFAGVRALKNLDDRDAFLLIGMLSALISYLVSEQFLFSVVGVTPVFWALVGGSVSKCIGSRSLTISRIQISRVQASTLGATSAIVVCVLLAMAVSFTVADVHYERGNEAFDQRDFLGAIQAYQTAVAANPWHEQYSVALVQSVDGLAWENQDSSWHYMAISYLERAIASNPDNRDLYQALGNIYLSQTSSGDMEGLERSITAYQKALTISPLFLPAHLQLAQVLLLQGEPGDALDHLDVVLQFQPNNEAAHKLRAEADKALKKL